MLCLRAWRFCFRTRGSISIVAEEGSGVEVEIEIGVSFRLSPRSTDEGEGGEAGVNLVFDFVVELETGLGGSLGVRGCGWAVRSGCGGANGKGGKGKAEGGAKYI